MTFAARLVDTKTNKQKKMKKKKFVALHPKLAICGVLPSFLMQHTTQ